jgi:CheY-specific phosphatase CheX
MSDRLDAALRDTARETFEQLAFLLPPADEGAQDPGPERSVRVAFRGPFRGELSIALSAAALPPLAANMLGVDDPVETTAAERDDAFRELANVVCGNLLPRIAGRGPVFEVDTPRVTPEQGGPDAPAAGTPAAEAVVPLECGRASLRLCVDDPAALDRAFAVGRPPA